MFLMHVICFFPLPLYASVIYFSARQTQFVSFTGAHAAGPLMPQFVPVSLVDPQMLAAASALPQAPAAWPSAAPAPLMSWPVACAAAAACAAAQQPSALFPNEFLLPNAATVQALTSSRNAAAVAAAAAAQQFSQIFPPPPKNFAEMNIAQSQMVLVSHSYRSFFNAIFARKIPSTIRGQSRQLLFPWSWT